jgi:hypothetical protein
MFTLIIILATLFTASISVYLIATTFKNKKIISLLNNYYGQYSANKISIATLNKVMQATMPLLDDSKTTANRKTGKDTIIYTNIAFIGKDKKTNLYHNITLSKSKLFKDSIYNIDNIIIKQPKDAQLLLSSHDAIVKSNEEHSFYTKHLDQKLKKRTKSLLFHPLTITITINARPEITCTALIYSALSVDPSLSPTLQIITKTMNTISSLIKTTICNHFNIKTTPFELPETEKDSNTIESLRNPTNTFTTQTQSSVQQQSHTTLPASLNTYKVLPPELLLLFFEREYKSIYNKPEQAIYASPGDKEMALIDMYNRLRKYSYADEDSISYILQLEKVLTNLILSIKKRY